MKKNKEVRVVFLVSGFPKSKARNSYQRAIFLIHNFHTVILTARGASQEIVPGAQMYLNINVSPVRPVLLLFVLAYLRLFHGYNLLHCEYGISSIPIGFLAKYLLGYIWLWDLWDHPLLPIQNNKGPMVAIKGILYQKIFRKLLRYVDIVLVFMQRDVLDTLLPFRSDTKIIYMSNGYNAEAIKEIIAEEQPDYEHKKILQVCYAGPVKIKRGLPLLVDYLNKRKFKIPLNIKLFGPISDDALHLIMEYNNSSQTPIEYLGELDFKDSLRFIRGSDICLCLLDQKVLGYRYNYPIKVFEYLAFGKIIIATRTHATMEIIIPGRNGFLINNSVAELENVFQEIEKLRKDGGLKIVSSHAQKTAEKYKWENINQRLEVELKSHLKNIFGFDVGHLQEFGR